MVSFKKLLSESQWWHIQKVMSKVQIIKQRMQTFIPFTLIIDLLLCKLFYIQWIECHAKWVDYFFGLKICSFYVKIL